MSHVWVRSWESRSAKYRTVVIINIINHHIHPLLYALSKPRPWGRPSISAHQKKYRDRETTTKVSTVSDPPSLDSEPYLFRNSHPYNQWQQTNWNTQSKRPWAPAPPLLASGPLATRRNKLSKNMRRLGPLVTTVATNRKTVVGEREPTNEDRPGDSSDGGLRKPICTFCAV